MKDMVQIIIIVNIIMTMVFSISGLRIVFSGCKYKHIEEKDRINYARGLIDISIVILAYTILIFILKFKYTSSIVSLEILVIAIILIKYRYIKNKYIKYHKKINID
ncbi:MAG: hypothetical protein ACRDB0_02845 [Paraclostridium sp.]